MNIVGCRNIEQSSAENIFETNDLQLYFDFMTDGRFPGITISASLLLVPGVSIKASRVAETVQVMWGIVGRAGPVREEVQMVIHNLLLSYK